uniref:TOG domain-containing protein n=1 Tax=Rhabditophanes sp. KR3021 TaxID=114890 RepID=A0AC35TWV0_9BILA
MTDLDQFYELVKRTLCTDNEIRKEAEARYESIDILVKCQLLFQLYSRKNCETETRNMSLVLLRRPLTNDFKEVTDKLGLDNLIQFRQSILEALMVETDTGLRKRLVEVISEFAKGSINDETYIQEWQEIIQFVAHASTGGAELREAAMMLLENVPNIFGEQMPNFIPDIKKIFASGLLFEGQGSVRLAAVRAYVSFMCEHESMLKTVQQLGDQIPAVLEVCRFAVTDPATDSDIPLQGLSDIASTVPKIINPYLMDVLRFCYETCLNESVDECFRHSALEIVVSFCEASPSVMRKRASNVIPEIINICIKFMSNIDDSVEEWLESDTPDEDNDDEEEYMIGENSLDRLSCALGGKSVLDPLLKICNQFLTAQDWKKRHAAIMALSVAGEGCKRSMEPMIDTIIANILPFMKDSNPRVMYAACNAIGQMSTDFGQTLQKKCHAIVIPQLLSTLSQLQYARVSAHAGAALVNFAEECPKTIITVYLDDIMGILEKVIDATFRHLNETGKKMVLEQVITTVASVADAAQDQFINFYDRLIPPLKYILASANGQELRTLKGKTIECISLIGLAVGVEKFEPDVNDIMQTVLTVQNEEGENTSGDPLMSYMISSWARICKILGEKFGQYLPMVMPSVMKAAGLKPEVLVVDDEGFDENNYNAYSFMNIGDNQQFGIKTAGLEDKSTACEMIVCYAKEAKSAFGDYVEPVMELMVPMLKFVFHDVVRTACAEAMPALLRCALPKGADYVKLMWEKILPGFLEAINEERDTDVLGVFLGELGNCIEAIGASTVEPQQLLTITELIYDQMESYKTRKIAYSEQLKDEDADEESQQQIDDFMESETNVFAKISDLIHSLFQAFGVQFLPCFEKIGPHFAEIIVDRKKQFYERQWAICIFDDLIEYCGPQSVHYESIFLAPMLEYLNDEFPEIRQAAAYGFGVMGTKGGVGFAEACRNALPRLVECINRPDARSTEESIAATENAISAVAKIMKCNSSLINVEEVIPIFMSWLPIWEDEEESPFVYGYLCDLIEANNVQVIGENHGNLPQIVNIITEAFVRGAFGTANEAEETKQRLLNILKSLAGNEQLFTATISAANLSEDQKNFLQKAL